MKHADIVFIEYPTVVDREPFSLGFRYMVSYLRSKGVSAEIIFPPKILLSRNNQTGWPEMLNSIEQIFCEGYKKQNNYFYKSIVKGILDQIQELKPLIIGFSPYDKFFVPILDYIKFLRIKGVRSHITIGGHYATLAARQILETVPEIDSVVCGEGELTICELLERVKTRAGLNGVPGLIYRDGKKIVLNQPRRLIDDLDSIPSPDTNVFAERLNRREMSFFSPSVSSSRGCYGNCSFCTIREFYSQGDGKRWRTVSPSKFVSEIDYLSKKFGFKKFNIVDDDFIGPGRIGLERFREISKQIKHKKMRISFVINARVCDLDENKIKMLKEIGLNSVFLGIESMSKNCLSRFNKRLKVENSIKAISLLKKYGILSYFGFIFFDPLISVEDIKSNLKIIDIIRAKKGEEYFFPYYPLFPLIGTPVFKHLSREGLLRGDYIRGFTFKFRDKKSEFIYKLIKPLYGNIEFIRFLIYFIFGFPFNIVGVEEKLRKLNQNKAEKAIRELFEIDEYLLLDYTYQTIKDAIKLLEKSKGGVCRKTAKMMRCDVRNVVGSLKNKAVDIFLDYLTINPDFDTKRDAVARKCNTDAGSCQIFSKT